MRRQRRTNVSLSYRTVRRSRVSTRRTSTTLPPELDEKTRMRSWNDSATIRIPPSISPRDDAYRSAGEVVAVLGQSLKH